MDEATVAKQKLGQLAEESGMTFDELVNLWAEDTAAQLTAATAALAAGRLAEAARLVHSASGASGICGIAALADELKSAELLAVAGRGAEAGEALANAQRRFAMLSGALHNGMKS
jgi:HPt (histidine-containing phosphotransfer) domain-containing protein